MRPGRGLVSRLLQLRQSLLELQLQLLLRRPSAGPVLSCRPLSPVAVLRNFEGRGHGRAVPLRLHRSALPFSRGPATTAWRPPRSMDSL